MSTDPSTTEQIAAAVLAEHADWDYEGDEAVPTCHCGESLLPWLPDGHEFGDDTTAHRAHVAQQIAARLDDGLAEALDSRDRANRNIFLGLRGFEALAQRFGMCGREVSAQWTRDALGDWREEMGL